MSTFDLFENCPAHAPFAQGDIFRLQPRPEDAEIPSIRSFCLLTADCDIAHGKMGDFFSALPIVPKREYLFLWTEDELEKTINYHSKIVAKLCNEVISDSFQQIDPVKLPEWASHCTLDEFISIPLFSQIRDQKAFQNSAMSLFEGVSAKKLGPEERLDAFVSLKSNQKTKNSLDVIRSAFSRKNIPDEYYLIPRMPDSDDLHVILLRDISAVPVKSCYGNFLEMKVSGRSETPYVRIGRFCERIKFSIIQKSVLLFSRIGLPDLYENEVEEAISAIQNCE